MTHLENRAIMITRFEDNKIWDDILSKNNDAGSNNMNIDNLINDSMIFDYFDACNGSGEWQTNDNEGSESLSIEERKKLKDMVINCLVLRIGHQVSKKIDEYMKEKKEQKDKD